MRNRESWSPTKCVWDASAQRFVPRSSGVFAGSMFVAGLQVAHYEPIIRKFSKGRLLDCGCGACPYYGIYRDHVTAVVCTDWPDSGHTGRHVDAMADLNAPLPFASEVFDSVLLTDVLEHIAEPQRLVSEVGRVLRPGGYVMIATPFFYWLHEQPNDYVRLTEHALRRYCNQAGTTVIHLSRYGGLPDVFLDLINKSVAGRGAVSRFFATAARGASRIPLYGRLRVRTETSFPLGYFVVAQKVLKA